MVEKKHTSGVGAFCLWFLFHSCVRSEDKIMETKGKTGMPLTTQRICRAMCTYVHSGYTSPLCLGNREWGLTR